MTAYKKHPHGFRLFADDKKACAPNLLETHRTNLLCVRWGVPFQNVLNRQNISATTTDRVILTDLSLDIENQEREDFDGNFVETASG